MLPRLHPHIVSSQVELLEQLLLVTRKLGRDVDENRNHVMITVDSLSLELEFGVRLGAGRDFELDRTVNRLNRRRAAERSRRDADRFCTEHRISLALKSFVSEHMQTDIEVAARCTVRSRLALAADFHDAAFVHARRDADGDGLTFLLDAIAAAGGASFLWPFAASLASRAFACLLHDTEHRAHGLLHAALTRTGFAFHYARSRLDAAARAALAANAFVELDVFRRAERGLHKCEVEIDFDVIALHMPRGTLPSAKHASKEIAEISEIEIDVLKIVRIESAETSRAESAAAVEGRGPELIILRALFLVTEDLIRLVDFFELRSITALFVRMVLVSKFPEGVFDFVFGS